MRVNERRGRSEDSVGREIVDDVTDHSRMDIRNDPLELPRRNDSLLQERLNLRADL